MEQFNVCCRRRCAYVDAARGSGGQARSRGQIPSGKAQPAAETRIGNHTAADPPSSFPEGEKRWPIQPRLDLSTEPNSNRL